MWFLYRTKKGETVCQDGTKVNNRYWYMTWSRRYTSMASGCFPSFVGQSGIKDLCLPFLQMYDLDGCEVVMALHKYSSIKPIGLHVSWPVLPIPWWFQCSMLQNTWCCNLSICTNSWDSKHCVSWNVSLLSTNAHLAGHEIWVHRLSVWHTQTHAYTYTETNTFSWWPGICEFS